MGHSVFSHLSQQIVTIYNARCLIATFASQTKNNHPENVLNSPPHSRRGKNGLWNYSLYSIKDVLYMVNPSTSPRQKFLTFKAVSIDAAAEECHLVAHLSSLSLSPPHPLDRKRECWCWWSEQRFSFSKEIPPTPLISTHSRPKLLQVC